MKRLNIQYFTLCCLHRHCNCLRFCLHILDIGYRDLIFKVASKTKPHILVYALKVKVSQFCSIVSPAFYVQNCFNEFWASVQSWLTTECGINCAFCPKTVLFGVLEKHNFLNTVICYARLHIMNCKVQKTQICMDRFIVYLENEGAY